MNINLLRLNGFFLVLVLTVFNCAEAAKSVSSKKFGVRYAVDFPAPPTCKQMEIDTTLGKAPREICYFFDDRLGHGFSAELATLPIRPAAAVSKDVLMGAASGAASSTDSEVVDKRFTQVASFPALDVTLVPREKGYVVFVRLILAGNDLITITADGYPDREKPSAVNAFLESARVLR